MESAQARERMDRSRIEMMRGYAETTGCRRAFLLGYFGEKLEHPCGDCGTCSDGSAQEVAAEDVTSAPPAEHEHRVGPDR